MNAFVRTRLLRCAFCQARTRIGGRVVTDTTTFGIPVEIGAQFIHGQQNGHGTRNPIYSLALSQGWATVPFGDTGETFRNGSPISTAEEDAISASTDDFIAWMEGHQDSLNITESMGSQFQKWIAAKGSSLSAQRAADVRTYLFANVEVRQHVCGCGCGCGCVCLFV